VALSRRLLPVLLCATAACAPESRQEARPGPLPQTLKTYKNVTAERLEKPEASDWLMIRRTYDGWGYSPLDDINAANVHRLKPVWVLSTGQNGGHEAPALVNNGVMFVATPGNQVMAIDVRTGTLLWRYRKNIPRDAVVVHRTTRGVALHGNKVFFAANDAVLIAIDARTGRQVWATTVEENKNGYYMTVAPLVVGNRVIVGVSGGTLGIRGFVAAYHVDTGAQLWRTFTIPAPGEPGSETWPGGDEWKLGGAATWVTGNYDPATKLLYWGTGNGAPWMGDTRPGDNLYTASTLAIDVVTGRIKGHHQYVPNESWDWDAVSPPLLIDYRRNGRTIRGLVNVGRDGYLWFLERTDSRIRFVEGKPYVRQTVFKRLDPVTGRPEIDPATKPGTGRKASYCPSVWGGKDWPPIAYSPKTRMIYIPANENTCGASIGFDVEFVPGRGYSGARVDFSLIPGATHVGEVQAWNVDEGQREWTHRFPLSGNWGPMLATAGGLVFSGGTNDRLFRAYDASDGKVLWEFPTNSGIISPPTSFAVDGRQYVAVQAGWGTDARVMQRRLNDLFPGKYPEVPEGGAVWVFAVDR
jgi:alcohol dehydrogenase (cytochrome c)